MNYPLLRAELLSDPLGRGYEAKDHPTAAADLNTAYRTRVRQTMTPRSS